MTERDFVGWWRITTSGTWPRDTLDVRGPAHLTFSGRCGSLSLIAIDADLDCRYSGNRVEFSLLGYDGADLVAGRGWAAIDDTGQLQGMVFLHDGEESEFTALGVRIYDRGEVVRQRWVP